MWPGRTIDDRSDQWRRDESQRHQKTHVPLDFLFLRGDFAQ
jgi:hypothetical protein